MIHVLVTGLARAFNVSQADFDRFVPSTIPQLFEARCLDTEEAMAIIERAGLVLAEPDPADGLTNLRTQGGNFAGCVGQTDTLAELRAHYEAQVIPVERGPA